MERGNSQSKGKLLLSSVGFCSLCLFALYLFSSSPNLAQDLDKSLRQHRAIFQTPSPPPPGCPTCVCEPPPPVAPPVFQVSGNLTPTSEATLSPEEASAVSSLCSSLKFPPGNCSDPASVCSWNSSYQFQAKCRSTAKRQSGSSTLVSLSLTDSVMNSTLDFLSGLTQLEFLSLVRTTVSGTIPSKIFSSLVPLKQMIFEENGGLSGSIPTQIGLLTNMLSLSILSSPLNNTLPTQISSLSNMVSLTISDGQLSGPIPSGLVALTKLEHLDLSKNLFTGGIPPFNQQSLLDMNLEYNLLDGSLPASFANLRLTTLKLERNSLTGNLSSIPTNLTILTLGTNFFIGRFPDFSALTRIQTLDASQNSFSGRIPRTIGALTTLTSLILSANQFSGEIPSEIKNLVHLQTLDMSENQLKGTMPTQLGALTSLLKLNLGSNQFSGVLPIEYEPLTKLQYLYLDNNQLYGGRFTFGSQDYLDCRLGDMIFHCSWDAPVSCLHQRCYSEYDPCKQNSKLVLCEPPATCSPLLGDYWYTCECPDGLSPANQFSCEAAPPLSTGAAVGIAVGAFFALLLLVMICIILFFYFRTIIDLSSLPPQVRAPYALFTTASATNWDQCTISGATFYSLPLKPGTEAFDDMQKIFEQLGGKRIPVKRASVVFNRILIQNFINTRKIMSSRSKSTIFSQKEWQNEQNPQRDWVYKRYQDRVNDFSWNRGTDCPILPSVHGTELRLAKFICATGFANLSLTDEGYYGKGIYFTTYALYAAPYFTGRKAPAILVSWLLPGNTYPIIENHRSDKSLLGTAVKRGFNSHFIVTTREGVVPVAPMDEHFDELVIPQEAQIAPVYLLELSTEKGVLTKLVNDWKDAKIGNGVVEKSTSTGGERSVGDRKSVRDATAPSSRA